MRVITKKRYYEEDLYCIPGIPGHGGDLTKGKLIDYAEHIRNSAKIEHKRGDFYKWKVRVEKYCCDDLKEYGKVQVEEDVLGRSDRYNAGIFLPFQGWDEPDYIRIDFCPFCGEKIEVVEEE